MGNYIQFILVTALICSVSTQVAGQPNPDFLLAENGVTIICDAASVGDAGAVNGVTYTKRTRDQITTTNAATTCTSGINDMSSMFEGELNFNEDISSWDVSSVKDMKRMFAGDPQNLHTFNQDIGSWDVSKVSNMEGMFRYTVDFNIDIGSWDVKQVTNMAYMFNGAQFFSKNLSDWCVKQISSKPDDFDTDSGFSGVAEIQPQWGTCQTAQIENTDTAQEDDQEIGRLYDYEDFNNEGDKMPVLIGGLEQLMSKMEYPEMARLAGIEGRVYVRFIVNEQGKVENSEVIRGIGGGADKEALRVARLAKFEPGYKDGKPVRSIYSLPFVFRLTN